jgi:hypothetical protein
LGEDEREMRKEQLKLIAEARTYVDIACKVCAHAFSEKFLTSRILNVQRFVDYVPLTIIRGLCRRLLEEFKSLLHQTLQNLKEDQMLMEYLRGDHRIEEKRKELKERRNVLLRIRTRLGHVKLYTSHPSFFSASASGGRRAAS